MQCCTKKDQQGELMHRALRENRTSFRTSCATAQVDVSGNFLFISIEKN